MMKWRLAGSVCKINLLLFFCINPPLGDLKYKGNTALHPRDQMITAEPDITRIEIVDDDEFLVVACDGVWDCKTNQEVVDFVRGRLNDGRPLSEVVNQLLDDCIADDPRRTTGIGGDNMTCIIVELNLQHKQGS